VFIRGGKRKRGKRDHRGSSTGVAQLPRTRKEQGGDCEDTGRRREKVGHKKREGERIQVKKKNVKLVATSGELGSPQCNGKKGGFQADCF